MLRAFGDWLAAELGHVDLRATAAYAALPEQIDDIAEMLDSRHQAPSRGRSNVVVFARGST